MYTERETVIKNYIDAYNNFNVDKMVSDFDEDIVFENMSNGNVNLSLTGKEAFKEQAEKAKEYFSERKQTIRKITHRNNECEVEINYQAVSAIDLPNGMKKGDTLNLTGRSIFRFSGVRVIALQDIS